MQNKDSRCLAKFGRGMMRVFVFLWCFEYWCFVFFWGGAGGVKYGCCHWLLSQSRSVMKRSL